MEQDFFTIQNVDREREAWKFNLLMVYFQAFSIPNLMILTMFEFEFDGWM